MVDHAVDVAGAAMSAWGRLARGWASVNARIIAGEHALAARSAGEAWACTCNYCAVARHDLALLALAEAQHEALVGAVCKLLDATGEDLVTP